MVFYKPELQEQFSGAYDHLMEDEIESDTAMFADPIHLEPLTVDDLPDIKGRLSKDAYEDHLIAAEQIGVGLLEDEKQIEKHLKDGYLVEANSGPGYQVEKLTHSLPYLTPHAKSVLDEIGQVFEVLAGKGNFIAVTSMTRTMDLQKNLKKRNRNATAGNSSHSYGVSFDISYVRFNGEKNYDQKAQKHLEKVLNQFQKTNKIYVIKERKQSCYHITVR